MGVRRMTSFGTREPLSLSYWQLTWTRGTLNTEGKLICAGKGLPRMSARRSRRGFKGVPETAARASFRGFDDSKRGQATPVQSALAEERRRIADFRKRFQKPEVNDLDCGRRE